MTGELRCDTDEFEELLIFLDYTGISPLHSDYINNLPRFRRFIYESRNNDNGTINKEFIVRTYLIHFNAPDYSCFHGHDVNARNIVARLMYLNINIDISDDDKRIKLLELSSSNPHAKYLYAYFLEHGIGGPKDEKKSMDIYLENWIYARNDSSLNNFATQMEEDDYYDSGIDKAKEIYEKLWNEFRNPYALYNLAVTKNRVEQTKLLWLNWEENRDKDSYNIVLNMTTSD